MEPCIKAKEDKLALRAKQERMQKIKGQQNESEDQERTQEIEDQQNCLARNDQIIDRSAK